MLNVFNFILKLNGYPISKAKKLLKEIQQIPEAQYEAYIKEQQLRIVNFHLQNNSIYRSLVGKDKIDLWEEVPIMRKSDLQKPLKERLSKGYSEKSVYINKTSGSSGHPFIFAKDKFCHALTWAEIIDRFGWFEIDFNIKLQARFYGIPLNFIGNFKERFKDWFSRRYRFIIFDLSDSKLELFLEKFQRKKFYYINGYTSSIVLFAKYLKRRNIVLSTVCPSLRYCVVTSEMLFESDKKLLETTLGVPIINEYGAAELDLIAFTNKKDEFVLNSETLFIEILDENYKLVPHGQSGKIIITSLYNKAHPLIRYEVGDIGILAKNSTFKTPILKELIGRTNDIATLPSGKTVPGLTFYYITKSVIEDNGNIKEFVVEQTLLDSFLIVYVAKRDLSKKEILSIQKALSIYIEDDLILNFERRKVLDRKNRGKLKQFNSYL